jgi:hypothetical protein
VDDIIRTLAAAKEADLREALALRPDLRRRLEAALAGFRSDYCTWPFRLCDCGDCQ